MKIESEIRNGICMTIYDKAHELANEIKESADFKEYMNLKDIVYADDGYKKIIGEYKSLQLKIQSAYMTGQTPNELDMARLKKTGEYLQFNEQVSDFLMAEYKINTMIGKIYQIIGDACGIDLDIFKE